MCLVVIATVHVIHNMMMIMVVANHPENPKLVVNSSQYGFWIGYTDSHLATSDNTMLFLFLRGYWLDKHVAYAVLCDMPADYAEEK